VLVEFRPGRFVRLCGHRFVQRGFRERGLSLAEAVVRRTSPSVPVRVPRRGGPGFSLSGRVNRT
jgi:hypothetical protein